MSWVVSPLEAWWWWWCIQYIVRRIHGHGVVSPRSALADLVHSSLGATTRTHLPWVCLIKARVLFKHTHTHTHTQGWGWTAWTCPSLLTLRHTVKLSYTSRTNNCCLVIIKEMFVSPSAAHRRKAVMCSIYIWVSYIMTGKYKYWYEVARNHQRTSEVNSWSFINWYSLRGILLWSQWCSKKRLV